MQLLQLYLLAEVQLAIANAFSSPLMMDYISPGRVGPGHTLDQTLVFHYVCVVRCTVSEILLAISQNF